MLFNSCTREHDTPGAGRHKRWKRRGSLCSSLSLVSSTLSDVAVVRYAEVVRYSSQVQVLTSKTFCISRMPETVFSIFGYFLPFIRTISSSSDPTNKPYI